MSPTPQGPFRNISEPSRNMPHELASSRDAYLTSRGAFGRWAVSVLLVAVLLALSPSSSAFAACIYKAQNLAFNATVYSGTHTLQHGNFCVGAQCVGYASGYKTSAGACYTNKVLTYGSLGYVWTSSPNFTCSTYAAVQSTGPQNGELILQSEHFGYATSGGEHKCFDAI